MNFPDKIKSHIMIVYLLSLLSPSNLIYCFDPLIIDNDIKFLIVSTILSKKKDVLYIKQCFHTKETDLLFESSNHQQWYQFSFLFYYFSTQQERLSLWVYRVLKYQKKWRIWQCFSSLLKCKRNWILTMAFWATCKIAQPI